MDRLEKVTACITRHLSNVGELLVFRHPTAGVQLPAGTVEIGETLEQAVLRETQEETGLESVHLLRKLSPVLTLDLAEQGQAALLRNTQLLDSLSHNASASSITLKRGCLLRIVAEHEGWKRVTYEEKDYAFHPPSVISSNKGWLQSTFLTRYAVRHFFHLTPTAQTAEGWEKFAEDRHLFSLYWVPLVPQPELVVGQNEWLSLVYEELLHLPTA